MHDPAIVAGLADRRAPPRKALTVAPAIAHIGISGSRASTCAAVRPTGTGWAIARSCCSPMVGMPGLVW